RIHAARLVWRRLHKQLPRLRLSSRLRGAVVQATVVASLLYASEVRPFSPASLKAYQVFLNRAIRGITFDRRRGGTRAMEGVCTSTDLRIEAGIDAVPVQVLKRQLGYLGHLARYPNDRLEQHTLGLWLAPPPEAQEGAGPLASRCPTLRDTYWKRIVSVMGLTGMPEEEWPVRWMEVARDRREWKRLSDTLVWHERQRCDADTWTNRHSESATAYRAELQGAQRCPRTGEQRCPRCGVWCAKLGNHLRTCDGTPPPAGRLAPRFVDGQQDGMRIRPDRRKAQQQHRPLTWTTPTLAELEAGAPGARACALPERRLRVQCDLRRAAAGLPRVGPAGAAVHGCNWRGSRGRGRARSCARGRGGAPPAGRGRGAGSRGGAGAPARAAPRLAAGGARAGRGRGGRRCRHAAGRRAAGPARPRCARPRRAAGPAGPRCAPGGCFRCWRCWRRSRCCPRPRCPRRRRGPASRQGRRQGRPQARRRRWRPGRRRRQGQGARRQGARRRPRPRAPRPHGGGRGSAGRPRHQPRAGAQHAHRPRRRLGGAQGRGAHRRGVGAAERLAPGRQGPQGAAARRRPLAPASHGQPAQHALQGDMRVDGVQAAGGRPGQAGCHRPRRDAGCRGRRVPLPLQAAPRGPDGRQALGIHHRVLVAGAAGLPGCPRGRPGRHRPWRAVRCAPHGRWPDRA
ncbi:unnamed protein product, partial [Prorocentrum cordatum]